MKTDPLKGLLLLLAVIAAMFLLMILLSDDGPAKAACVVRAVGSHIAIGSIGDVCALITRGH